MNQALEQLKFEKSISLTDLLHSPPKDLLGPGVYAFWWIGDKSLIYGSSRKLRIKIKNVKRNMETEEDWVDVMLGDENAWPICLYVGKAKQLHNRMKQHLLHKRDYMVHSERANYPNKDKAITTSCQLRYGIEHIFYNHPIESFSKFIIENVSYSYYLERSVKERFYQEDYAIGHFRPWFNIDSER